MNEQKPLENITIEEFNLYRKAVQKTKDIYVNANIGLSRVFTTVLYTLGLMVGYTGIQTSLGSLQTNPQKGDYFLFGISSFALLFCAVAAIASGRDLEKTRHQIKTLETELDKIKKDPIYQKLENIEYSQTTGMNHNEENKK